MKNKKKKEQKCHICFQHFKREKLNKHMHSRSHHEAIERLKGGQQSHTCLACKVSALGLEQYVTHISTTEHLTNLDFLEDNCRKNGIAVDYNDAELNAICALRDQKRLVLKPGSSTKGLGT
ncbi:zinc finger protein 106 [Electrophorus electricus]|uniref:zinc finger protein 106 n=1 Tax=Electrophorus electricus TaxID=8005 RepID=UPI000F0A33BB|nr:zinc finger protein 106 [Electrophorus electricus]